MVSAVRPGRFHKSPMLAGSGARALARFGSFTPCWDLLNSNRKG